MAQNNNGMFGAIPAPIYSDSVNSVSRATSITVDKITVLNQTTFVDFSVNQASVKTVGNGPPLLQTRVFTNDPGAFNGSGTGNKAILGIDLTGPLSNYESVEIEYINLQGDVEPIFGGSASNESPYINLQVDINGDGSSILLFSIINYDDSVPEQYSNGAYRIVDEVRATYNVSWNSDMTVNVVGVTNGADLGGITPVYSAGPNWQAKYWSFQDILAANPDAKIVNYRNLDNGFPVSAVIAGMSINSGDSAQQVFSSKLMTVLKINDKPFY